VRLDVFLKQSRLIKRRTVAREACERGLVLLNGRVGKPASEVKVGDTIALTLGSRHLTVQVVSLPESPRAADATGMYRTLADETGPAV